MTDFAVAREAMVARQIEARGIDNPALCAAFRSVPREAFVAASLAAFAYDDTPLPIEAGQTISQPYIVALMIDAAGVKPGDRVLEIGAGSGYAAAVMSRIAERVVAIERVPELAESARLRLARLGRRNVEIVAADGSAGWPAQAPFDAIIAAASGRRVPQSLLDQRVPDGTLVMPVGAARNVQALVKVVRTGSDTFERTELCPVRFVPLIGVEGWAE